MLSYQGTFSVQALIKVTLMENAAEYTSGDSGDFFSMDVRHDHRPVED